MRLLLWQMLHRVGESPGEAVNQAVWQSLRFTVAMATRVHQTRQVSSCTMTWPKLGCRSPVELERETLKAGTLQWPDGVDDVKHLAANKQPRDLFYGRPCVASMLVL